MDTKGKEKLGWHNNNDNEGKKKALMLLLIQTFKSLTRGAAIVETTSKRKVKQNS